MRKGISILLSAVFIITLISSTPVSSVRVSDVSNQQGPDEGFIYLVKVDPTFVRVNQGEFGIYTVQVLRGSGAGQFSVDLSLISESSLPTSAVTFNPSILNFEQGQKAINATLKINSHELASGSVKFRVEAATRGSAPPDQALSNPAALIVRAAETRQSSNSLADSQSEQQSLSSSQSLPAEPQQERTPAPKLNNPPIAKAGPDQAVQEGDRGILDGSASTDADKDPLLLTWEQLSPRQPSVKLASSDTSYKASFVAPDVNRDTMFRFKLVVKDSNGGIAADSVNILIKNVEEQSPETSVPSPKQETVLSSNSGSISGEGAVASAENHSPTAEAMQTVLVNNGNPLSISLKGNDPDKDDTISYELVSNPSRGSIAGFDKTTGSLTYVPTSGFTGQDRLSFKVVDNHGAESNDGLVVMRASAAAGPTSSGFPSDGSTSPSPPSPKANENATESSTRNNTSGITTGPSLTERNPLTQDINASAVSRGRNQTGAAPANQTGSGNQTLASNMSSFAALSAVAGEQYSFVLKWGTPGSGNGQFNNPHAVAIDSLGNAYVLDSGNNRVQKFDSNGNFLLKWGGFGTGNGQFKEPHGIAVDRSSGDVYVVDTMNNRVQKFSNTGSFKLKWGGSGQNQMNQPEGIGVDSLGNVYVSDVNNHRIIKTNSIGGFLAKWGSTGAGQGQFKGPHGVAIDTTNNLNHVYVSDFINNKVQKFSSTGTFLASFGSTGSSDGQFNTPHGVAVDSEGSVYVTDRGNNRVQKFDNAGTFLTKFGNPSSTPSTADGQFNGPDGVAISPDSTLQVYVSDTGNNRVQVFSNLPPASITMSLDNTSPKWGHLVTATGSVTGATVGDKVSIDWGDGPPLTEIEITPDPQPQQFTATHIYAASAMSPSPQKVVVGKVLNSQGGERARTPLNDPGLLVTLQKHATILTDVGMRPSDQPVCSFCHFIVTGKLLDKDSVPPNKEVGEKPIVFTGSGASSLSATQTRGFTFSKGASNENLTVADGVLRMHVGSEVSLPYNRGVNLTFTGASGPSVGITLTKALAPFDTVSKQIPVGSVFPIYYGPGFTKMTITDINGDPAPSGFADLKSIVTTDPDVALQTEEDQDSEELIKANFGNNIAEEGEYSTLKTNNGSIASAGVTPSQDGDGFKVTAAFDAVNDLAYLGSTSAELSYNVNAQAAGTGVGDATTDAVTFWNKLTVGTAGSTADACTFNGAVGADADKDGLCDAWENSATAGNTATQRYVTCPTKAGHEQLDASCTNPLGKDPRTDINAIKYNLCHVDKFADAPRPSSKSISPAPPTICPKVGHKDVYVEVDYKSNFVPSDTAIRHVIRAFSVAPVDNAATDDFGNSKGITLHVIKDESISTIPDNLFAWRDPPENPIVGPNFDDGNLNNDFFNIKKAKFGTSNERSGQFMVPAKTNTQWLSHGDSLKHYAYHYGLWVKYYSNVVGQPCDSTRSSGVAELRGNDLIVSLGCGFGTYGENARSIASQAGTFMHELGHNFNLGHGGISTALLNVRTQTDYEMNCKPNYLSVMSYSRQVPFDLVAPIGTLDSADVALWESKLADGTYNYGGSPYVWGDPTKPMSFLDYSRSTIPAVSVAPSTVPEQIEQALREDLGSKAADNKKYKIIYLRSNGLKTDVQDSLAPFDWNGDGSTAGGVGDINKLGTPVTGCAGPATDKNRSYSDWDKIELVFLNDGDSQDGANQAVSQIWSKSVKDLTGNFIKEVQDKADEKFVQFVPPPNYGDIFNAGQSIPFKFRLKNPDGSPITNAVVTFVAQKPDGTQGTQGSFTYIPAENLFKFEYNSKPGAIGKGLWFFYYFVNFGTPNQYLLQMPQAKAANELITLKLTGN